ncbi:MAG: hypothetical protein JWO60_709 [Frankiales bacterium]|nr:hypothetical protein [Frankiales bacterium]
MDIWIVIVGVMVVAALVAAAGGFRSFGGRRDVVSRPVRRREVVRDVAPVEEVVERRID